MKLRDEDPLLPGAQVATHKHKPTACPVPLVGFTLTQGEKRSHLTRQRALPAVVLNPALSAMYPFSKE